MNTIVASFKSLGEFDKWINETPLNQVFRWEKLESTTYSPGFNKSRNFNEALELLRHGWDDMAKKIENNMKLIASEVAPKTTNRQQFNVAGFQASVPRYLQGIPTSMIDQKKVQTKQKVITIVKHIGYLGNVSEETIIENSIKALQIVKKIEAKGYRVNLDVLSPAEAGHERAVCRIRIKAAAERMNISKIAFPIVHPDMLRRMVFRFREAHPDIKSSRWKGGYGSTIYSREIVKSFLNPGEYYLHNFIDSVDEEIEAMQLK